MSQEQMFCYQCEQTSRGQGCTVVGVCGKNPEVATLQDLLIYILRGISQLTIEAGKLGIKDENISLFTCEALFATLTNVNFDPDQIIVYIRKAEAHRESLRTRIQSAGGRVDFTEGPVALALGKTKEELLAQGKRVGVKSDVNIDPDLHSLHWLLTYGLKGVAAYTYHAYSFGKKDERIFEFVHRGLAAKLDRSFGVNEFVGLVLECGEINLRAMELLDAGNTETYGHPVPTKVPLGVKKGKAILVSGHDLIDLDEVLKQSEGKGILRLHPRRDAARPRVPKVEEVPPLLRSLRNGVAEPAKRIPAVPRGYLDDDELHSETPGKIQGQHFHFRSSWLAGHRARCRKRLFTRDNKSAGYAWLSSRH